MYKERNYYRKSLGNYGEKRACKYLEQKGYHIIQKNFSSYKGEIDIIAKDKDEFVFFEVKTRRSKKYGMPVESVNTRKMKHIIESSKYYIYKNFLEREKIRYDIIEVYIIKNNVYINHLKNILF